MTLEETEQQEKFWGLVLMNIISANHTIYCIEQLTHQDRIWMRELKNYGNLFLSRLMKIENHFDHLSESESTIHLAESFQDFMNVVNTIHLKEVVKHTNVLRALQKDEKSILGITKKILGKDFVE